MNIIILMSKDADSFDLAYRLAQEGNAVKFHIHDKDYRKVGNGFGMEAIRNWEDQLKWLGKDGLVIFDNTGWGRLQDELRAQGYSVVGGSEGGDKLEFERYYAQDVFATCGMKTVPSRHFVSVKDALTFVKTNKGRWVVKQNGHADKCFSYRGTMPDGSDVIDLLRNYRKHNNDECDSLDLQQRVDGVELGVARYFNGQDWLGPIEMNIEHKKLFPGSLGPKTSEMGTLMWYDDDEKNRLFTETLARLKPHLQEIDFRGDIDINCIVNEHGAVPLEATPRFGYPAIHGQTALHGSPWGSLLKAVADGKSYDTAWRNGFAIIVLIAVPPFPYDGINGKYNPEGLKIYFGDNLTDEDRKHVHFSEVSRKQSRTKGFEYVVSAGSGYVMCVTGVGDTVEEARRRAYGLAEKIVIPKMFYRNDIGLKFIERDRELLEKWGYL